MQVIESKIASTLKTLLNELKDECLNVVKLVNQLDLEHLTEDQIDDILGELSAALLHLQMHSELLREEIDKED
jgi:hypothetical protein